MNRLRSLLHRLPAIRQPFSPPLVGGNIREGGTRRHPHPSPSPSRRRGFRSCGLACFSAGFTAGFTKIELLVSMCILALLSGLATPGFMGWLPGYRLRGAVRDLYSNLQLAKSGAIRYRAEWAVAFNAAANTYQVVSGGPDRIYSTTGDNVVQKTVSLPDYGSRLSFGPGGATRKVGDSEPIGDCVSFPSDRVIFNSLGMTTGTLGGYAYVQNERNACYAIGTWSSGIVVLRKWNGSAWE